ncbi:acyltransferase family protein [Luteimonas sp. A482]
MSGWAVGPAGTAGGSKSHFRPDIQGLRAIAVLLVLVYHVWPGILPGGFIGVDVFFVISGFLITSLLRRELELHGRIGFADFYARRVKRLLPAALVVLMAILLGTLLFLPVTNWRSVSHEVAAAALYVENWWLVHQAVDYLALDGAASPVQHFWSLSVEEQFYFFWPLLLASAWYVGRRRGGLATTIGLLGLVLSASLVYSVWSGLAGNSAAYFSTLSRVWQLAAGGMLVFLPVPRAATAFTCLLVGLVAIALSGVLLSGELPYPGYLALGPTLGAALALYGGGAYGRSVATRWLASKPAGFIGDVSYSLYLWHWPLIVFYKAWAGVDPGWLDGLALMAAALILAALTKRYVEDPFRRGHGSAARWRTIASGLAASLLVVVAALWMASAVGEGDEQQPAAEDSRYPGAMVMLRQEPLQDPLPDEFLPRLPHVEQDVADAYQQDCIQNIGGTEVKPCRYGDPGARLRIAVVGDSHAVHWLPAFELLARDHDVYIEGLTKTSCITSGLPVYHQKLTKPYVQCNAWTRNVIDYLNKQPFDLVVISQSPRHRIAGRQGRSPQSQADDIARGMADVWSGLRKDTKLAVIRPTPWQTTLVRDCVASNEPPYEACTGEQDKVLFHNALSSFAGISGHSLLDFTDMFCRDGRCPPVIGNVFVYRDSHHVTASYMRTLAPVLAQRLGVPLPALRAPGTSAPGPSVVVSRPSPELAAADRDDAFAHGCLQPLRHATLKVCRYGSKLESTRLRVAVVGDATGANILPALKEGAVERGWRIETYLKESCFWSDRPVWNRKLRRPYTECTSWSARVTRAVIQSQPDLVLLAQSPTYTDDRSRTIELATPRLAAGSASLVRELQDAGIKVVVLRSLPVLSQSVPQCLLMRRDPSICGDDRASSLRTGALDLVAAETPGVAQLDLTSAFCTDRRCEPIIDGVLVYRDGTQPTRTFARTLAPAVEAQLLSVSGAEPALGR